MVDRIFGHVRHDFSVLKTSESGVGSPFFIFHQYEP